MRNLIISDIDGVLANCEHRLFYAKNKLYDTFYEKVSDDTPIHDGISLIRRLYDGGSHTLVLLTGRRETCREATRRWLKKHTELDYDSLFMRRDGDHRDAAEVKKELYSEIVRMFESRGAEFDAVYFIDDDPENVKAICENDSEVTGLTFGVKRMEKTDDNE